MWQLNPSITFEWFSDSGEYLLYSPEVSETILVNSTVFETLQHMKLNSRLLLTEEGVKEILEKISMTMSSKELEEQIDELMGVLQKKYMVRRI